MIAEHHENFDAGIAQPAHAVEKVESGLEITQLAVEDIARQKNEAARLPDGEIDKIIECLP
jgi:hypothetical protein